MKKFAASWLLAITLCVPEQASADAILSVTGIDARHDVVGAFAPPPSLNQSDLYNGVARLIGGGFGCSGSLLWTGLHILTAAHCIAALGQQMQVAFFGAGGGAGPDLVLESVAASIFPGYTGAVTDARDIGVVSLAQLVEGFARYDIYRDFDEGGQTGMWVGYGLSGTGATGATLPFGTRRAAANRVDAFWDALGGTSLAFDFDDGTTLHSTIGTCVGPAPLDLGLGAAEGLAAPGDSGAPFFLVGLIAGVHSWGGSVGPPCDALPGVNTSFGDVGGDARVSLFADWLDTQTQVIPEPASIVLIGSGLVGLLARYRTRRKS